MSKQHYGALAGIIAGYVAFRILSLWAVRMAGDMGGHRRAGDIAVGVIVAAVPFAVLILFALRQLRRPRVPASQALKALFVGGWFVAGVVMGVLPYSRMGTSLNLRLEEARDAPGFLHGVDVTIVVGMVVILALLFAALRARHEPASAPVEWMEHQFEDER